MVGELERDPIDDTAKATIALPSSDDLSTALVIRCQQGSIEIFSAWSDYLGSDDFIEVTTRLDDDPPETIRWGMSVSGTATFLPVQALLAIKSHTSAGTRRSCVSATGR